MSGGGGGGSSIIAAYAIIRNLFRQGRTAHENDERAALDYEERRETEYTSMGLPVPADRRVRSPRFAFFRRLLRR